jgi:hypothetical protein
MNQAKIAYTYILRINVTSILLFTNKFCCATLSYFETSLMYKCPHFGPFTPHAYLFLFLMSLGLQFIQYNYTSKYKNNLVVETEELKSD